MQLTHLKVITLLSISKAKSYDMTGHWSGRKLAAFVLPARGGSDSSAEEETDDAILGDHDNEWEGLPSLATESAQLGKSSYYEEYGDIIGEKQSVEVEAGEEESLSSSEENYKFLSVGEGEADDYGLVGEEENHVIMNEIDFYDGDNVLIKEDEEQPQEENDAVSNDSLLDDSGNLKEARFHADHDEEAQTKIAHEIDTSLTDVDYQEGHEEIIQPIENLKTDNLTSEHEVISTPRIEDDDSCIDRLDEADAYDDGETSHASVYAYEGSAAINSVEEVIENTETSKEEESYILQLPKEESSSMGVQFVITRRMRKMLIYELNYSPSEVDQMRAEVAAVVIENFLKRPPSGMPAAWAETRDFYQSKKQPSLSLLRVKKIIASVFTVVAAATIMTSMGEVESVPKSLGTEDASSDIEQDAFVVASEQEGNAFAQEATICKEEAMEKIASAQHFPLPRDLDETWLDKIITRMVDSVSREN